MTHLFKLKKDGKDVGRLRITCNAVMYKNKNTYGEWLFTHSATNLEEPSFDTAHPFVCKDKNGKDMFVEDKIRWPSRSVSNHFCEDVVKANYMRGAWVTSPAGNDIALCHILADIELIEVEDA